MLIELEVKDDWLDKLLIERLEMELHAAETGRNSRDYVLEEGEWNHWAYKVKTLKNTIRILKGEW